MNGYPQVEVMIGGESTIVRDMTEDEKADWDFVNGTQWSPEQIKQFRAKNGSDSQDLTVTVT